MNLGSKKIAEVVEVVKDGIERCCRRKKSEVRRKGIIFVVKKARKSV